MMKQVHFKMPLRMLAALFSLILSASALGQQITVKGHVVDATGEGVIGATVRVNGTGGTVTDFDGEDHYICVAFNTIAGFTYEKGNEYELLVKKTTLANPPKDSGSTRYELIRIISQRKIE